MHCVALNRIDFSHMNKEHRTWAESGLTSRGMWRSRETQESSQFLNQRLCDILKVLTFKFGFKIMIRIRTTHVHAFTVNRAEEF